ncbi:LysR substrate-binding domain-containing protein [Serratia rhizosphaerae]|uniref:LysR family transcriptional regulator n=1 Tax=Serratia rhizosphaerae TaxID=2597702 RepID=A0ABX6GSW7_9GAMM|nr:MULTISPECIES: LysR substrate-binding domain-containing protein [Serratia]MBU3892521.1 LysR family transcriptional regulator [Serratia rubidaea]AVJ17825.1 LysR family transcriptional regulator [Serratia sp. MYb239]MCA4822332.1 LysR family transcriptional regulator [Serratia rubidaea]MEB6336113.1 LysR substrate-binding domain-containing protein [Serratia rhizosphaerae]QHA89372.1 LysR family transcriptional regulator [Serratia rhizosphaerae]
MEIQKAAIPSIKALQVFEQVAHFGNVARAAEELNITPSAASHQLAKLEKLVGNSLFNRSAKGVSLTLAGETYLREISQLLLNLAQATAQIRDQKENNALRIHCAPSFGLLWLLPRLKQLHEACPELNVTLSCSYENLSFSRDNIDVAIRHGFPDWSPFDIKTIRDECITAMASPDYLQRHPAPSPAALAEHQLILSETPLIQWPQWFAAHHLPQPERPWVFSFDRSYMSLQAARLGHGVVLESELLARDYLRDGSLVRLFPAALSLPVSAHHLVYPRGFGQLARVKRFLHWMQQALDSDRMY